MMTLWVLGTQDSFRSVAVKFCVPSRGTVHYHYISIIEALREMSPRFMQWPSQYERDNIKSFFERRFGIPGVVGCIDGTHIYISAPLVQAQRYVNRFKKYSILLQAVCDHNLVFRDIYVGQPGSVHDSRMFNRSPLSQNLLHNHDMLAHDEHILGDGAYTLTDKLLTPYRENANFNRRRRHFNYTLSSARSSIERAFMMDKGKWRRQKLMLAYSLSYVVDTIVASCMLHNFILLEGHTYLNVIENEADLVANDNPNDERIGDGEQVIEEFDPALQQARVAGQRKREQIAYFLHPED